MNVPNNSKIDFMKGCWFIFKTDNLIFAFFASAFTGHEKLIVNGKLVSEKRNYKVKTSHEFSFEGNEYSVELYLPKLFSGQFSCALFKNGMLVKKQETVHKANYLAIAILSFGFFIVTASLVEFGMPVWGVWVFFVLYMLAILRLASYCTKFKENT